MFSGHIALELNETRTFGSRVIYERYGRARDESERHRQAPSLPAVAYAEHGRPDQPRRAPLTAPTFRNRLIASVSRANRQTLAPVG